MERLTRIELGKTTNTVLCNHSNADCNDSCQYGLCKWINKALHRLKAYEDTRLTPEEIKGIITANESLVKRNDKLFAQHKHDLQTMKELDDALREYQDI